MPPVRTPFSQRDIAQNVEARGLHTSHIPYTTGQAFVLPGVRPVAERLGPAVASRPVCGCGVTVLDSLCGWHLQMDYSKTVWLTRSLQPTAAGLCALGGRRRFAAPRLRRSVAPRRLWRSENVRRHHEARFYHAVFSWLAWPKLAGGEYVSWLLASGWLDPSLGAEGRR